MRKESIVEATAKPDESGILTPESPKNGGRKGRGDPHRRSKGRGRNGQKSSQNGNGRTR